MPTNAPRKASQSPVSQGQNERIAYTVDFTKWANGLTVTNPSAKLMLNGADVTATNLSGSCSVNGNIVTTPLVIGLTPGNQYRLNVLATINGNLLEAYCIIVAEE